jgi:diacylglycerol kinase (ATP)
VAQPPAQVALIADPGSGRGTHPEDVAEKLRAHGVQVALVDPDEPRGAAVAGADRIAVAGGDGRIAPAAAAAARARVPLAVIPLGTANDFARGQGLPDEADAAARLATRGTTTRPLDLGWIDPEERPFVNAAGAGLASRAGETASGLKRALGPFAYLAGAVWSGISGRPLRCAVRVDGAPFFDGEAWQVTVAGTGSFGAGAELREASAQDGLLDAAVLKAGSRPALVRLGYGLRARRLTEQSGVRHARGAEVELELDRPRTLNVDGELVMAGPVVRLRVEPEAFRLVVPDQSGADSPS